jgi:UDP-3-O-[3-hydroxymyristoyl] glucosamine N-acyltransferase
MPDPRFFESLGPVSLGDLAAATGAELTQPELGDRSIQGVSILTRSAPDRITFLSDRRQGALLSESRAGACFVSARDVDAVPQGCAILLTPSPQAAYAAGEAVRAALSRGLPGEVSRCEAAAAEMAALARRAHRAASRARRALREASSRSGD